MPPPVPLLVAVFGQPDVLPLLCVAGVHELHCHLRDVEELLVSLGTLQDGLLLPVVDHLGVLEPGQWLVKRCLLLL